MPEPTCTLLAIGRDGSVHNAAVDGPFTDAARKRLESIFKQRRFARYTVLDDHGAPTKWIDVPPGFAGPYEVTPGHDAAEAALQRVRDASAFIRAITRTWDPVADIIDAALDEGGDPPVHARVALAVRTVLNQDLPGDMGGHVATAVLAVLRKEPPNA
ncbi:hypothetical protein ABZ684_05010 [Streptomyces sp. NPDC006995]|uniref:hypothetical protein n=1 Tax=Streptomyces sp. NPDC006995 TaxID=3156907 RepID=UPI003404C14D